MNLIRKLIRRLVNMIKGPTPTDEEIAERIISKIREGGGSVGDNVDIILSKESIKQMLILYIENSIEYFVFHHLSVYVF